MGDADRVTVVRGLKISEPNLTMSSSGWNFQRNRVYPRHLGPGRTDAMTSMDLDLILSLGPKGFRLRQKDPMGPASESFTKI